MQPLVCKCFSSSKCNYVSGRQPVINPSIYYMFTNGCSCVCRNEYYISVHTWHYNTHMRHKKVLFISVIVWPCVVPQTAQRKIREIVQQVKQQEQKHQQGGAVSPQHAKWPAGRLQQAPANECSPPKQTETYPDTGQGQGGLAGPTSSTGIKTKELHWRETSESQRLRALCALPALWESDKPYWY